MIWKPIMHLCQPRKYQWLNRRLGEDTADLPTQTASTQPGQLLLHPSLLTSSLVPYVLNDLLRPHQTLRPRSLRYRRRPVPVRCHRVILLVASRHSACLPETTSLRPRRSILTMRALLKLDPMAQVSPNNRRVFLPRRSLLTCQRNRLSPKTTVSRLPRPH